MKTTLRKCCWLLSSLFVLSMAYGQEKPRPVHPLFSDTPELNDGALGEIAGKVSKVADKAARAATKEGRYPQVLFEDWKGGDQDAKFELYRLARSGDENARMIVGWMFDNGVGVPVNYKEARDHFLLSAPKVELARYNLGVMYMFGRGVEPDLEKSIKWFGEAERIVPAYMQIANYAVKAKKGNTALLFAQKAAQRKSTDGMYLYGRLLLEKGESREGFIYVRRAANRSHPQAMEAMSVIYENGWGTSIDLSQARAWWIVREVLHNDQPLDSFAAHIGPYKLNKREYESSMRFARRFLMNRKPYEPFNYKVTLNFGELPRF